ncbi:hypothetical protein DRN94_000230 [archaeon]|nr:hypothetical protein [archaeon]
MSNSTIARRVGIAVGGILIAAFALFVGYYYWLFAQSYGSHLGRIERLWNLAVFIDYGNGTVEIHRFATVPRDEATPLSLLEECADVLVIYSLSLKATPSNQTMHPTVFVWSINGVNSTGGYFWLTYLRSPNGVWTPLSPSELLEPLPGNNYAVSWNYTQISPSPTL